MNQFSTYIRKQKQNRQMIQARDDGINENFGTNYKETITSNNETVSLYTFDMVPPLHPSKLESMKSSMTADLLLIVSSFKLKT